jgi:hypothetical protein
LKGVGLFFLRRLFLRYPLGFILPLLCDWVDTPVNLLPGFLPLLTGFF